MNQKGLNKLDRLRRIGKKWRDNIDRAKEYEIVESEYIYDEPQTSIYYGITTNEYQQAQRLKQKLLNQYQGKRLESVLSGEGIENEMGSCYRIVNSAQLDSMAIDTDCARRRIISELKLIHGIGGVTEQILKEQGIVTIEDLHDHPRFGSEAKKFLSLINKGNQREIIEWLIHWLPRSHPLVLFSSGLHKSEDYVVIDIETMGLFTRPIVLFGVAQLGKGKIVINQYLLRDITEEPAALIGLLSHVMPDSTFITFNGRAFDLPYIKERLAYYGIDGDLERPHFDMLHFSRRAWKNSMPDCRLSTLEKHLFRTIRADDVPSALVPEFYETYLRTGNVGPLVPIIDHNRQDLISLANVFFRLHEEWQTL